MEYLKTVGMKNGVSASDWAGTCRTAALCADKYLSSARQETDKELTIQFVLAAEEELEQAADEIKAIRQALGL